MTLPLYGFLGGGRMASAIAKALANKVPCQNLLVYDPDLATAKKWADEGKSVCQNPTELFSKADWIIWALKPQVFWGSQDLWSSLPKRAKCWLSVMAGVPTGALAAIAGEQGPAIIRTMPNTPLMLGEGMVALCAGPRAEKNLLTEACAIFSDLGKTLLVEENQMDGVTAISGSGPAYAFYLAEVVEKEAENLGLNSEQAKLLWAQTLAGAAKMLLESGLSATVLREQVTSPAGTTQAAIESFNANHLNHAFARGLLCAKERSIQLAKKA